MFIFGPLLERHWGASKFLTFYLITGLGASVLYSGVRYYEFSKMEQ
ncbi:MAG: rhomboid family intramembrane serine protease [Hymenobacteraceae bacterium]|nr:rhomboid family intramembrane serine protease [Hymenobacteraceae bacterium]MDX5397698.1 rhomboid family intramembrane serine protease [Hymenobacteraceae bacterium]MDX5513776.1 rhomboid family intramembrane serine protease [Hymenobacteraceae bacterium]